MYIIIILEFNINFEIIEIDIIEIEHLFKN